MHPSIRRTPEACSVNYAQQIYCFRVECSRRLSSGEKAFEIEVPVQDLTSMQWCLCAVCIGSVRMSWDSTMKFPGHTSVTTRSARSLRFTLPCGSRLGMELKWPVKGQGRLVGANGTFLKAILNLKSRDPRHKPKKAIPKPKTL